MIVSNCSNNYGPYHFPEKLIPLTIINALAGEQLPVYGNGENVRDWLYVEDHARALLAVADRAAGSARPTMSVAQASGATSTWCGDLRAARRACCRPHGRPRERLIDFVTDRPGHDARYAIDAAKLETELGWAPREELRAAGSPKTVRWYLDQSHWWERSAAGRYAASASGLASSRRTARCACSVTGATARSAASCCARRARRGVAVVALDRAELDIARRREQSRARSAAPRPDIVVNAAAYTAVDQAESEPELAFAVNADGAAHTRRAPAPRAACR